MFEFCMNDHKYSNIHFIGIGGISMSGMAEILLSENYNVSGSDAKNSDVVKNLKSLGADIYIGHSKNNIKDCDLVIYTDAIAKDNEELKEALDRKIETVDRATFLGSLIGNYTNSIAVSGTHGKTSTTSMIASILNQSDLDPTILLGGKLDEIGGNVRIGNKEHILTEACEYKANVLKYYPSIAIILNIEEDHMDFFRDMDHIVETFIQYSNNVQEGGYLILNLDDPNAEKIIKNTKTEIISFGIDSPADYRAENIVFNSQGLPSFDLRVRDDQVYKVDLSIMGTHNIYNTLASIVATHIIGIPMELILRAMRDYGGTHRRLEFKGKVDNITIIDDYAHHPTEIKATLKALRKSTSKIWCIFQPHTYTRTRILMEDFSKSFSEADEIIITDIYAAREKDTGEVHAKDLADKIEAQGKRVKYIRNFSDIEDYLLKNIKDDDLVITMGAGDIHLVGENILDRSKK